MIVKLTNAHAALVARAATLDGWDKVDALTNAAKVANMLANVYGGMTEAAYDYAVMIEGTKGSQNVIDSAWDDYTKAKADRDEWEDENNRLYSEWTEVLNGMDWV